MPSIAASAAMLSLLRAKVNVLSPIASSQCLATLYWLMPLLEERADRHALELRDPGNTLGLAQLLDGLAGDHAAVAHHHQLLDTEAVSQPFDLGHESLVVGDIALVHRHSHRTAARSGAPAVVD